MGIGPGLATADTDQGGVPETAVTNECPYSGLLAWAGRCLSGDCIANTQALVKDVYILSLICDQYFLKKTNVGPKYKGPKVANFLVV